FFGAVYPVLAFFLFMLHRPHSSTLFPTRRSSDLTANGEHDMFILGWSTPTGDADYAMYALFHSDNFGEPGNRTFTDDPELDALLDRKSTRLNSSHVSISYAVFCLKKITIYYSELK